MTARFAIPAFAAYGIELEYVIVDAATLDVRPDAAWLLDGLARNNRSVGDGMGWCNELAAHVVEVRNVFPAPSLDGFARSYQDQIRIANDVLLFLQRTQMGKATRAVADNRDLAESSGINVDRVITFVWAAGAGLAGLGGILQGLSEQVSWQMGFQLLLLMFAGVTLGGLGTAYGALVGSLVVGVFVQMSTLVIGSDMKYVGGLLLLIVILVIRPQGILGSRARIG